MKQSRGNAPPDGGGGNGQASSREERDKAIERVLSHTPPWYIEKVYQAWRDVADEELYFTCEPVRKVSGDPPNHVNAFSALTNGAIKRCIVIKVGSSKAKRRTSHARHLQLYTKHPGVDTPLL